MISIYPKPRIIPKANPDINKVDRDKLTSVAQPEWSCWKTGIELSCFGVKLLRICELEGRPFYGAPGEQKKNKAIICGDIPTTS